VWVRVRVRVRL
jgi:hypothetical protein